LLGGKLDRVASCGHNSGEARRSALHRGGRAPGALRLWTILVCLCLIGLAGCSGPIAGLPIDPGAVRIPPDDPAYETTVQIKYLGAGSVLIKRGADSLLTAPFFSNPSIPRVIFGEFGLADFKSLPEQVDRFLGRQDEPDLAAVTAVLVGHAHYDHMMDLPYIKKRFLPRAKIYGSDTMRYTLTGDIELRAEDLVSVERGAWEPPVDGEPERTGQWWYASGRLRFMALKSEHAPIIGGIKFFEGHYHAPLHALPTRPSEWREGQTLAYLIDFLGADGRTVEFRIHYQDAASTPPSGFPPGFDGSPDQRDVDVAILCMPGYHQVTEYPEGIIGRVHPRAVLLIHWEDFFAPLPDDPRDLRTVPTLNAQGFLERLTPVLRGAPFKMPAPGAWVRYAH
jgi:L-ascorbate metabolism protein UlaG (beta-lactamase superfamily)